MYVFHEKKNHITEKKVACGPNMSRTFVRIKSTSVKLKCLKK